MNNYESLTERLEEIKHKAKTGEEIALLLGNAIGLCEIAIDELKKVENNKGAIQRGLK